MKQYTGKDLDSLLAEVALENKCTKEEITYNVIDEKKHLLNIGNSVTIEAWTPTDVKEFIFNYLGAYFEEMNQGVSIEIIVEKSYDKKDELQYRVILDGENNAIIIGKSGQTLRAINSVVRAATNATFKRRINVIIDVNHYKEDRYKKVKSIAFRVAKEVQKSHVDASLDPMPNDERKVIHQHLQTMHNITTISEGDGPARHIVIKYVENNQTNE